MKIMRKHKLYRGLAIVGLGLFITACIPAVTNRDVNKAVPEAYYSSTDTVNIAQINWRDFFTDQYLLALIDTALKNNQELNIILQEINMSENEIMARKGEYLPFVNLGTGAGVEKVGRYTSQGANDANTDIEPGKAMPDPLGDYMIGAFATWEVDIWHKLRNAKESAVNHYLASIEGKNFMVTNLVSEIANSYYELLALDNQLALIQEYITIQNNALKIVRTQKEAGEVTELAVRKFEAEVLNTQSKQYDVQQMITETENHLNFLLGRFPQPITRDIQTFNAPLPDTLQAGIPSQLMENRPDIRQSEYELTAAKLDLKVARAQFYPSFSITAGLGFDAFNPAYFVKAPESIIYGLAGELSAPLVNRKAIKADYFNANAKQLEVVYHYEQTILNAYVEVANQVSKVNNLKKSYDLKNQEVQVLNQAILVATELFKSAKADYMEVLLTQRDALGSRLELIEYKKMQLMTMVNLYRALGGGWN